MKTAEAYEVEEGYKNMAMHLQGAVSRNGESCEEVSTFKNSF